MLWRSQPALEGPSMIYCSGCDSLRSSCSPCPYRLFPRPSPDLSDSVKDDFICVDDDHRNCGAGLRDKCIPCLSVFHPIMHDSTRAPRATMLLVRHSAATPQDWHFYVIYPIPHPFPNSVMVRMQMLHVLAVMRSFCPPVWLSVNWRRLLHRGRKTVGRG